MAFAMSQKFEDEEVRLVHEDILNMSLHPLPKVGGFTDFKIAATASSKFSSPPSGLLVRALEATSFWNSFFSENEEGYLPSCDCFHSWILINVVVHVFEPETSTMKLSPNSVMKDSVPCSGTTECP